MPAEKPEAAISGGDKTPSPDLQGSDKAAFLKFALTCARIGADSRKLEKVRLLSEYLQSLDLVSLRSATTWFSGRPFPGSHNKVLNLGWAVLRDSLLSVGGIDEPALHAIFLKHSDVGESAFEVLQNREQQPTFSIRRVDELFHKLLSLRGPLGKTPVMIQTLEKCTPLEAKYLVKIITGDLRIGLKEGLVEEAIASAFSKFAGEVRQANLLLGDIGEVAKLAAQNRLGEIALVPFRPIKFMLASPESTAADIWERIQGGSSNSAWLEDKYDGIRAQLHKVDLRAALYSRDLKDITATFPEITDSLRNASSDFILDGEIVAMKENEILPFAELQKRLGRREPDLFLHDEVPVKFVAFDLLWLAGESYLDRPLRERRAALESVIASSPKILPAQIAKAHSAEEIETAFEAARARGNEGLMIKNPSSAYSPGRRGFAWLKLKKAFATLDCVVVGAEYGHGKRNKVLSDYTFAVRDEETGELKTIGKAYSGLTDVEIAELTQHFLQTAIRQHGRYFEVKPDTILEIAFDKIAHSDRHSSGLAMRFPRILRIRTDKPISEIDTLATAQKLAEREASRFQPRNRARSRSAS